MIKVKKLDPRAILPTKAYAGDLAYDLYALENYVVTAIPAKLRTGIAIELPLGFGAVIKERSSLGWQGFQIRGGVIDNGYRGEWLVTMQSHSNFSHHIKAGQKMAQFIVVQIFDTEVIEVESLSETTRSDKGYGSSGV